MSCVYCKHYKGLQKKCEKGVEIKNLSESFNCENYQYNQKVKA